MAETDPVKIVEAFLAAWSRLDPDELSEFFAEDAVWEDGVPSEPYRGKAAIRAQIARYVRHIKDVEIEIHTQVAQGKLVMHERTDRLTRKGKRLALQAMSVFEVVDGKITANRDYWNPTPTPGASQPT